MATTILDRLERWKSRYGADDTAALEKLLEAAARLRVKDAASLVRLHETLLFLRAYPRSATVARLADRILGRFAARVEALRRAAADLSALDPVEVSGMAGTAVTAVFSYEVARRMAEMHPREVRIDWEGYSHENQLGSALARLLPLLGEDWPVEAHFPHGSWLRAAAGRRDLPWLLHRIEQLPLPARERAALFDSLEVPLCWEIGASRASRSRMRLPGGRLFCHDTPLLRRSDVSLERELAGPALPVTKLSRDAARRILDVIMDTSVCRYRELYGFSHPDAERVYRAEAGRGVDIYFLGVPPEWRLPLRAYHSAMFFKNGVPAGYVEVLSLFERTEVGFNLYYTFREGESAWLYARVLRLFRQLLGSSCFSVDSYQIGYQNPEAVDSGAFWFYRKLGFRPVVPAITRLMEREEQRMQKTSGYRTPPRTLERMAEGNMVYEAPGTERGRWDRFAVRNIGYAAAREMAKRFGGDPEKMRRSARAKVTAALGVETESDLTLALSLVPDLAEWSAEEKAAAAAIVRAKDQADESRYLHQMQRHERLRNAWLRLGSTGRPR